MKSKIAFVLLAWFAVHSVGLAQPTHERAFRIRKSQFPSSALYQVAPYLDGAKRIRFYQEIDSSQKYFDVRFKKDRLHYSARYHAEGALQAVELGIGPVDIPGASWEAIGEHLKTAFGKYQILQIMQQYPRAAFASDTETFRNAYQNLLLPEIRYKITFRARSGSGQKTWEAVYDASGQLLSFREALPTNYDHVLY